MTTRKAKATARTVQLRAKRKSKELRERTSNCKGKSQYRGLSTAHHERQRRDASVEMTGYG
jgi:hypothetical protein